MRWMRVTKLGLIVGGGGGGGGGGDADESLNGSFVNFCHCLGVPPKVLRRIMQVFFGG